MSRFLFRLSSQLVELNMGDIYHTFEGSMILEKVTPVIRALFTSLNLRPSSTEPGTFFFSGSDALTSWSAIQEDIVAMIPVAQVGPFEVEKIDSAQDALYVLAGYLKVDDYDLMNFLETNAFSDDYSPQLHELVFLARKLDDGHGLRLVKCEGSWDGQQFGSACLGGDAQFFSDHFDSSVQTSVALAFAQGVGEALEVGDIAGATHHVGRHVEGILNGLKDDGVRTRISFGLACALLDHDTRRPSIPMSILLSLWSALADVPVNDQGQIEEAFMGFAAGTDREVIWHWFEGANPRFIVGEIQGGRAPECPA